VSGWFLIGKEELLSRVIPAEAGVWIAGVNTDYEFNEGQTEYSLIEPFVILPAMELTNVTFTNGVMDADDPQWIAAGAGAEPEDNLDLNGVIIFFALEDSATLLAYIDRPAVGLPQTLKGVNVTCRFDTDGILKL
jgi:hypothetical protein